MEAVGLAAGILPIFTLCLDYFQLYKTAQASSDDSQILLYKLDCEHESFLIWGEKHGVFDEQKTMEMNPGQDQRDKTAKVTTALNLIHGLLSDAEKLRERYGVGVSTTTQAEDLPQEPYPSNSGLKRLKWFRKKPGDAQSLSLVQKTRWAINDKAKFQHLITDLHDLVDSLYKILPVPVPDLNAVAIRDIRSLVGNLDKLEIFEKASQDVYPAWSGAASVMREAGSTTGAPDAISQWVAGVEDDVDLDGELDETARDRSRGINEMKGTMYRLPIASPLSNQCFLPGAEPLAFSEGQSLYGSPFFVFTSDCPSSSTMSCDLEGLETSHEGPSFVFADDNKRKWGLGNRITEIIDPKIDGSKIDGISNAWYELQEKLADIIGDIAKAMYPASWVCIYCPPCRCALRTALLICEHQNKRIIHYRTRIDDRIPCTCCPAQEKLHRLRSIHETACNWDRGLVPTFPNGILGHIDRAWLEKRIYNLETELHDRGDCRVQISKLLGSLFCSEREVALFLGEASQCSWVVQTKPFPWSPRVPKANEIFRFSVSKMIPLELESHYLGTFTSPGVNAPENNSKQRALHNTTEVSGEGRLEIGPSAPGRAVSILSGESGFTPMDEPTKTPGFVRTSNSSTSHQASDETGISEEEDGRSSKRVKL
ncbi:hypothetical protein NM208_g2684 [Fusarium decemcellulare]|uniref:Uncharacterized protein n=1 Tax=Fusarium decemcellulare TaxID=57161 RepID=A0ACC1SS02_9HYPO|nr:hypothetical protein NM208_g2684 [Fusarium decemcellulare]